MTTTTLTMGLRGLLLGLVVVLALLGSALFGSAGEAHADCRGVPASFRPTCVQNDAATYLSDLYVDKVPGSDQDHLNMALQVSQALRWGEQPGTIAETLAQNTGLTLVQAQDVVTEANFWMYPNFFG